MLQSTLCAVLLTVSLLMPGNASAYDSQGKYIAFAGTCGKWLSAPLGHISKINWINGYKTAVNLLAKGRPNFFEGTDVETLELYVDKYCREYLLRGVQNAMAEMLIRLKISLGRYWEN